MKFFMTAILTLVLSPLFAQVSDTPFTFEVAHDHLWGKGRGKLSIDRQGVVFEEEKKKDHSRKWSFGDIQEIKIESPGKIEILTYEDVRWKVNQDRAFKFELLEGTITPEVANFLSELVSTPVVSAVFAGLHDVLYSVPAKHKHGLGGGCEGRLMFDAQNVYYSSSTDPEHSRTWPIAEIQSLGRRSAYDFRITVQEHTSYGVERNFQFQLKEPLDETAYDRLWGKVYEPETWLSQFGEADSPKVGRLNEE